MSNHRRFPTLARLELTCYTDRYLIVKRLTDCEKKTLLCVNNSTVGDRMLCLRRSTKTEKMIPICCFQDYLTVVGKMNKQAVHTTNITESEHDSTQPQGALLKHPRRVPLFPEKELNIDCREIEPLDQS